MPILKMYVYPMRGVRSPDPVSEIFVSQFGVKYDRELMLMDPLKGMPITSSSADCVMCLEQRLYGNKVVITTKEPQRLNAKNLPIQMELDLDVDPTKVGPLFKGKKHNNQGHRYSSAVCDWFSIAIDKEVILLHSATNKLNDMDPGHYIHMAKGDQRKTFTTDAAFHIINKASVDDLRERVIAKHPEMKDEYATITHEIFRPNLLIDTGKAYSDDHFQEIRVGTCLLRCAGPSIRCNALRCNYSEQRKYEDTEPNSTLNKYRFMEGFSIIFGMFYQSESLDKVDYDRICSKDFGFPSLEDTLSKNEEHIRLSDGRKYIRIKKGDPIRVRHEVEHEWKKALNKFL